MKNTNNTIGNRNRDLPACSTAPPPTAPPRTRNYIGTVRTKQDRQRTFNVTLRRFLASVVALEKQCIFVALDI
jgi:predicted anti-sigma-YlaC factor YlaD